jgi:hypothetical protein
MRKPEHRVIQDTVLIRGILDLLDGEAEPVTEYLVQLTQHVGPKPAARIMKLLQKASVVEHPLATKDILGAEQKVPCLKLWQLTATAKRGQIPSAEALARGVMA